MLKAGPNEMASNVGTNEPFRIIAMADVFCCRQNDFHAKRVCAFERLKDFPKKRRRSKINWWKEYVLQDDAIKISIAFAAVVHVLTLFRTLCVRVCACPVCQTTILSTV